MRGQEAGARPTAAGSTCPPAAATRRRRAASTSASPPRTRSPAESHPSPGRAGARSTQHAPRRAAATPIAVCWTTPTCSMPSGSTAQSRHRRDMPAVRNRGGNEPRPGPLERPRSLDQQQHERGLESHVGGADAARRRSPGSTSSDGDEQRATDCRARPAHPDPHLAPAARSATSTAKNTAIMTQRRRLDRGAPDPHLVHRVSRALRSGIATAGL